VTTARGDLLPAAAGVELEHKRKPWQIWCIGYPPAGQRRHWLLVVDNCPFDCGGSHAHRGGGPEGGIKRAGCGGGAYVVLVRSAEVVA
jgi:hypothetical protein